ncbi:flotillin 1 [Capsaspora owczarzaki ATCC 30864]|uniref:Flotillin 1 n=1 Tax=Capsaspora owczarzaki (strain ATCC 30864) TaxID=595528 RepID=A0A0D2WHS1_CAPO3|nr:flotillin 1 [Capsaspora owczarzaki ATCC 30864]KJE88358.1 flotillin 1 [Capsaspora owczarzaki ATCC 30864]|eukprot:XP_004364891.1 flotillin 1 [Capsaspora owczarzaki ATCC 30864]
MVFRKCGPNEIMVVSGMGYAQPRVLNGGSVWVWSGVQQLNRLSLNVFTVVVQSHKVYTHDGVAVNVTGVAQVKVESHVDSMLRSAIQQFLGKSQSQIAAVAHATLEGHQRAIMGTMTVEEIYQNRLKFSTAVFQVASTDLSNMGISIVSFTIKDVSDEEGYLAALGMKRTAEVKRDAAIGEAEAKAASGIEAAKASEELFKVKYTNDAHVASAQRTFNVHQAEFDAEVQTSRAQADLAYDLSAAKLTQGIREQEIQIQVVERQKQIEVQQQEIARKEKELTAQIAKPAEAERYQIETVAAAKRLQLIYEAEARAEAVRLRGEAEAFAIREKAKAEKEKMLSKAEAYQEYQDAALVGMVLEVLPRVAAEVAHPLTSVKKITMVSSGNGEVGASKLTNELLDIVTQLPPAIEKLTGVNISNSLRRTVQRV